MRVARRPRVVVLGSSFAGYTTALVLARATRRVDGPRITVVAATERFVLTPALLRVPFCGGRLAHISFSVRRALTRAGVEAVFQPASRVDLARRQVRLADGTTLTFDFLVVATGARADPAWLARADGAVAAGAAVLLHDAPTALRARQLVRAILERPGPVVIGAAPGAGCFEAPYELAASLAQVLRERRLQQRAPITFVTPEPYAGHFGLGVCGVSKGIATSVFGALGVTFRGAAAIESVEPGAVVLADGERLPCRYALLMPPFVGSELVTASAGLGDGRGFVEVDDDGRHAAGVVSAAGAAVAPATLPTPLPCMALTPAYLSERMGEGVAHQLVAASGGKPDSRTDACRCALCRCDPQVIEKHGVRAASSHLLSPAPRSQWARTLFERQFIAARARGAIGHELGQMPLI